MTTHMVGFIDVVFVFGMARQCYTARCT